MLHFYDLDIVYLAKEFSRDVEVLLYTTITKISYIIADDLAT